MQLEVWRGDWGLPSIDHNCLAVMAYCKFASVPITVLKGNNPWRSPSGTYPVFSNENEKLTNIQEIFNNLRKNNWGTDSELNLKQSADIVAYTAMMEEKLLPALLYCMWGDSKNYVELTRPWYCSTIPFPFNFYLPQKWHKSCVHRAASTNGHDSPSDQQIEDKLYRHAKECLNYLEHKLGDTKYFFGTTPSSLDAIVFGYLAPLYKAPLKSATLQNHLKSCPNLCNFCHEILTQHFPLTPQEQESETAARAERDLQADSSNFPHRKRNLVMAGLVALGAMVAYALLSGMVVVEIGEAEGEPSEDDDDDDGKN